MYVRLTRQEMESLIALAADQRRRPADQAALFITEGLRRHQGDVVGGPTPYQPSGTRICARTNSNCKPDAPGVTS
jgi:hypothetical protein